MKWLASLIQYPIHPAAHVKRAQAAIKIIASCTWRQRAIVLQVLGGPADDPCHHGFVTCNCVTDDG